MNDLATTILLRFASIETPDSVVDIWVDHKTKIEHRDPVETHELLSMLQTADLIRFSGHYNCGTTRYTITLTERGQQFVALLRERTAGRIASECEPGCGDMVRFGDREGIVHGTGTGLLSVVCSDGEHEVRISDATLVNRKDKPHQ